MTILINLRKDSFFNFLVMVFIFEVTHSIYLKNFGKNILTVSVIK